MKKLAPAFVALLALLAGGFFFLQRETPHHARAAEIAPPEALLFLHLPDLARSAQRWRGTALAQLWREPEVQAFFKMPLERMPLLLEVQDQLLRLERIGVREVFAAITSAGEPAPGFVAGLSFTGSKSEVAALMSEPWSAWRKAHPAGQTELLSRPHWEIETNVVGERLLAGCFFEGWYFLANDLPALEATLARCRDRRTDGLAAEPQLQRATAPLPDDADVLLFAHPGRLLALLGSGASGEAKVSGTPFDDAPTPLGWTVKLEGAQIRDTIFLPGAVAAAKPLTRRTHALHAADTLLYGAFLMPEKVDVPPVLVPLLATLTSASTLAMDNRPFTSADFAAAFGPECAVVLDWPEEQEAPAFSLTVAVRDPARATGFVETITGAAEEEGGWPHQEAEGVTLYQAPPDPKTGAAPALAVLPGFVVLGAEAASVRAAAGRLHQGRPASEGERTPPELAKALDRASEAVGIVDLRRLFSRSYDTFRPFLRMSLAFSPETGPFVDVEKLPSTEVLARHLEPTIYTQTVGAEGLRIESSGSLSLSQTLAGAAFAISTSALQSLRKQEGLPEATPAVFSGAKSEREEPAGRTKAAENSGVSPNVDEKSQIYPFQR